MIRYLFEKLATVYFAAVWSLPLWGACLVANLMPSDIPAPAAWTILIASVLFGIMLRTKAPFTNGDFS